MATAQSRRRPVAMHANMRLAFSLALSAFGAFGVLFYLSDGLAAVDAGSTVWALVCMAILVWLWRCFFRSQDAGRVTVRLTVTFLLFSLLFGFLLVAGRTLDAPSHLDSPGLFAATALALAAAAFPCATFVAAIPCLGADGVLPQFSKKKLRVCFAVLAVCWLLGWLAAFPGIYGQDAPYWYLEFDGAGKGVSSQWSPVYAGLFYLFVHSGYELFGWYGYGLAAFTAVQMAFVLFTAYRVMRFAGEECGNVACVLVAAFYALVPAHMVMAISTAQGAPFMGCVAMAAIHFARMALHGEAYWANWRNPVACVSWCVLAGVFRNNMLYALILMLFLLPLFRAYWKQVAGVLLAAIACIAVYSGPYWMPPAWKRAAPCARC